MHHDIRQTASSGTSGVWRITLSQKSWLGTDSKETGLSLSTGYASTKRCRNLLSIDIVQVHLWRIDMVHTVDCNMYVSHFLTNRGVAMVFNTSTRSRNTSVLPCLCCSAILDSQNMMWRSFMHILVYFYFVVVFFNAAFVVSNLY